MKLRIDRPVIPSAALGLAAASLAIGGLAWTLRPAVEADAPEEPPGIEARRVGGSVSALAQRLERDAAAGRPVTAADWELLARSYAALGRFREADRTYAKACEVTACGAQALADRADVVLAAADPGAADRAAELVRQALVLEPLHPKALTLGLGPGINPSKTP